MSEKEERLPSLPFELPDPLEFLSQLEEVIEEVDKTVSEVDNRMTAIDRKASGIDKRFAVPKFRRSSTQKRDVAQLMRSQFNFSCPICEEIAEKVSKNISSQTDQVRVYESIYKLTSKDKKSKDEAVQTLQQLGVLPEVSKEIKANWEKLKSNKTE